jgi:ParB family transcriptional regulator, chromosome partitioning protein
MSEILKIDPRELKNNPWNTNRMTPQNEAKLDESIKRLSMFKPVVARELEDGSLQILGGQHRSESAIRLGMAEIDVVNLGAISEVKAKEIGLIDNGRYGSDDGLELAKLLEELDAKSDTDLSTFMPYSNLELDQILTSTEIDLDSLDMNDPDAEIDVYETKAEQAPSQTHQIMRFKVPFDDAQNVQDAINRIMERQDFTGGDSLQNAGDALVHLVKTHDAP